MKSGILFLLLGLWLLELAFRDQATKSGCDHPPSGWWCGREPGHDGPCAARREK